MAEKKIDHRAATDPNKIGDIIIDVERFGKQHQEPPINNKRGKTGRQVKLEQHIRERTLAAGLPVFPRPKIVPEKIIDHRAFYGENARDAVIKLCIRGKNVQKPDVDGHPAASHDAEFNKPDE
jgi:hypothetical protein